MRWRRAFHAFLATAMLALLLSGCARPVVAVDPALVSDKAHAWLKSQLRFTGLVDSQQDFRDVCYTYDQAVAAIALLARHDTPNARKILDAMKQLQAPDGAWYTAYSCKSLQIQETQQHVGPVMWIAMAAAYYEQQTGDTTSYRDMARQASAWALQFQQPDGGINGGVGYDGRPTTWASTEHNLDAYAALTWFGYPDAAAKVKAFLDNVVWDATNQRWYAGRNDSRDPLDVNTWGVSALGATGSRDYRRALDYSLVHHRTTQSSNAALSTTSVDGFDFDSNRDDVWLEGTGEMALALKVAGRTAEANAFIAEIIKTQDADGGVPYALKGTDNGFFSMPSANAVSSTGWLIFAIHGVNPFQPRMRLPATTTVLPGGHPALALDLQQVVTAGLLFFALAFGAAVVLLGVQHIAGRRAGQWIFPLLVGASAGAALLLWLPTHFGLAIAVPVTLNVIALVAAARLLRNFTLAGRSVITSHALFMLFAWLWVGWFIATMQVSTPTRALLFAGYTLLVLMLPTMLIHTFERWELICRSSWTRPHLPLAPAPRTHYPKVSVHVACYAEPPEVVIATLDALARVRYPNFEVLLIDNNTPDPALWQPVEAHCQALGARFRFIHLHRWYGAKSGALNYALQVTAPDAELIALLDSDYQPEPQFLDAVVGYFDDPKIGFVQTPHDYRDWQHSRYQRMCYWEYKFGHLSFASLNERDAAVIVGTMCVIRRKALQEIGGWARWCVTEDSESSIRLHAAGYSSIYLTTTLGRGIMPETFSGYKKQRFRWAYGPVQELKHHLRYYLPRPFGVPNSLTTKQKLHHLNHGLEVVNSGLGFLLIPLGVAIALSMLWYQEVVEVPVAVGLAALVLPLARLGLRWLVHRVVMDCSLQNMLGGMLASTALSYTISRAALAGIVTRSIAWRRTSKFKALPMGLDALSSARSELLLGLALVLFSGGAAIAFSVHGLLRFLLLGMAVKGISYFAAPALAILAERDLRSQQTVGAPTVAEPVPGAASAGTPTSTNQA